MSNFNFNQILVPIQMHPYNILSSDSNNNIAVSTKNSNFRKTFLENILIIIEIGLLYKVFSNMPNWNVEKLILKKRPYDHNIKYSATKMHNLDSQKITR
jgi:hypothetical protein